MVKFQRTVENFCVAVALLAGAWLIGARMLADAAMLPICAPAAFSQPAITDDPRGT
jgi:hypothetical protein